MKPSKNPSSAGTPEAEVVIDRELVFNLLKQQHPDLAHLPITLFDAGWDNVIFRLGDKLSIRLPRRQAAAKLIEHEQIWLPEIAKRLTIPVPTPCRIGQPASSYPWRWSILPWLEGTTADLEQLDLNQGKLWGTFLRSLHTSAPLNSPSNPVRGVPLRNRAADLEPRIQRLEQKTDLITQTIKNIWHQALDASIDVEAKWLHGDLHPGNILVKNGEMAGIIDWGDITSGDVATDLASIWMLFDDQYMRQQAITQYYNISAQTLQRAKGWAIYFGVTLLDVGLIDNSRQAKTGEQTLRCVAEE